MPEDILIGEAKRQRDVGSYKKMDHEIGMNAARTPCEVGCTVTDLATPREGDGLSTKRSLLELHGYCCEKRDLAERSTGAKLRCGNSGSVVTAGFEDGVSSRIAKSPSEMDGESEAVTLSCSKTPRFNSGSTAYRNDRILFSDVSPAFNNSNNSNSDTPSFSNEYFQRVRRTLIDDATPSRYRLCFGASDAEYSSSFCEESPALKPTNKNATTSTGSEDLHLLTTSSHPRDAVLDQHSEDTLSESPGAALKSARYCGFQEGAMPLRSPFDDSRSERSRTHPMKNSCSLETRNAHLQQDGESCSNSKNSCGVSGSECISVGDDCPAMPPTQNCFGLLTDKAQQQSEESSNNSKSCFDHPWQWPRDLNGSVNHEVVFQTATVESVWNCDVVTRHKTDKGSSSMTSSYSSYHYRLYFDSSEDEEEQWNDERINDVQREGLVPPFGNKGDQNKEQSDYEHRGQQTSFLRVSANEQRLSGYEQRLSPPFRNKGPNKGTRSRASSGYESGGDHDVSCGDCVCRTMTSTTASNSFKRGETHVTKSRDDEDVTSSRRKNEDLPFVWIPFGDEGGVTCSPGELQASAEWSTDERTWRHSWPIKVRVVVTDVVTVDFLIKREFVK
jgi:hypothetical protein